MERKEQIEQQMLLAFAFADVWNMSLISPHVQGKFQDVLGARKIPVTDDLETLPCFNPLFSPPTFLASSPFIRQTFA